MNKETPEKKYNDVLKYFGMNREISPDIAVLHAFLGRFYNCTLTRVDLVKQIETRMGDLENSAYVTCKETDEVIRKELFEDLKEWTEGVCLTSRRRSRYPIPIHESFIYKDTEEKNDLLVHMLYPDSTELFESDKAKLNAYLFTGLHDVYTPLVSILLNIIREDDIASLYPESKSEIEKSEPVFSESSANLFREDWLKQLCKKFRRDFEAHLASPYFEDYDIYRRLNSLMLLLNLYATLFMVFRAMNKGDVYILVKGSSALSSADNDFHTAAIGSFSDIRERVFLLSEIFYDTAIKNYLRDEYKSTQSTLKIGTEETEEGVTIEIEGAVWADLRKALTAVRKPETLDKIIIDYLQLEKTKSKVDRKDLAKAFVDYSKKRASSARKISSIFSVQGQQAKFVYPQTSSHKYYAMSPELTELLLMLFLAGEGVPDAPLDTFTKWLSTEYGIFLCYSADLVSFLNERSIKVPVFSSFEQNRQDFIQTLDNIGALKKKSDNSYIVHYSRMVGDFD